MSDAPGARRAHPFLPYGPARGTAPVTLHVPHRSRPGRYALGADPMCGRVAARQLCCPFGHHLRDGWLVLADKVYRCEHRAHDIRDRKECAAMLYVIGDNSRLGLLDVYEVDVGDIEVLTQITDPLGVLAYLGAPIWRPLGVADARHPRSA